MLDQTRESIAVKRGRREERMGRGSNGKSGRGGKEKQSEKIVHGIAGRV